MIDAQPEIAAEGHHPVVPPGEAFLRLFEQPECIAQPECRQPAKGITLRLRHMDFFLPVRVGVTLIGCDVVIAKQRQGRVSTQLFAQPVRQCFQPGQLVGELSEPTDCPFGK